MKSSAFGYKFEIVNLTFVSVPVLNLLSLDSTCCKNQTQIQAKRTQFFNETVGSIQCLLHKSYAFRKFDLRVSSCVYKKMQPDQTWNEPSGKLNQNAVLRFVARCPGKCANSKTSARFHITRLVTIVGIRSTGCTHPSILKTSNREKDNWRQQKIISIQ